MNLDFSMGGLWALPLASVRTLAMFMAAPIFGHRAVPVRIRVVLGLAFAVVAAPLGQASAWNGEGNNLEIAALVANEVLIGVALGFALNLAFMIFAPLGELISVQGGLGAANVLDPANGVSSPVIGTLLQTSALVIFLSVNGHHALLRGLSSSFERLPLGVGMLGQDHFGAIVALGSVIFEVTVRLAAPVMVVMIATNVGVGMLGRAIPQLNLMAVQLPAQIAITLIILGLSAAPLSEAITNVLDEGTQSGLAAVVGD